MILEAVIELMEGQAQCTIYQPSKSISEGQSLVEISAIVPFLPWYQTLTKSCP